MNKPTNTKTLDPMILLAAAMVEGPSRSIENMEAQGQRELVASETLPVEVNHPRDTGRAILEAAGVVFGSPFPDDPIFCPAKLPAGWKKVGTDHAMWSKLVDDKGRERAGIFYKAAFYDRSAFLNVTARFHIQPRFGDGTGIVGYEVRDGGKVVFSIPVDEPQVAPEMDAEQRSAVWTKRHEIEESAQATCADWLVNQGFPNWRDAAAYWD
jgi:hypothetical protein